MKYTTVRGSKNIRLSLGIAALGFVIGFVAGGYVLAGLGIFNGVIGAILGFLFKYYISGSKKPGVEEIE